MIKTSVKGRVKKIYDLVQYSEKFSKRMIVLETDDQYNNEIAIDFINAQIEILNRVEQDQKIKVFCDVFSRPSTKNPDQYFTNVKGWKIEHDDEYVPPIAKQETTDVLDDGLPF
tara:strand:+ start:700 stop:1041 length:342 start_codon:yes stop_codon:yes gene_type:complete